MGVNWETPCCREAGCRDLPRCVCVLNGASGSVAKWERSGLQNRHEPVQFRSGPPAAGKSVATEREAG